MNLLKQLTQNLPKAEAMQSTVSNDAAEILNRRKYSNNFPTP